MSISEQVCLEKLHTLLYIAYCHVHQINNGFNIYNNFKSLIVEVLHDIISNGCHFFFIKSNMAGGSHHGFVDYSDPWSK